MLRFVKIELAQTRTEKPSACMLCDASSHAPADGAAISAQLEQFFHLSEQFDGLMFGGFEPFAHPDLVGAVIQARASNARRIGLQTDGGALSVVQNARGCVDAGVRIFEISWLGASESSHDALTKKQGLFSALHKGIAALHQVEHDLGVNLAIIAVLNMCSHNQRELLAMALDAIECGITALRIEDPHATLASQDITALYDLATTQGVAVFGDGVFELESAHLYILDELEARV